MKALLQDPTILIPVGVILIGLILFIWAAGKLFKKEQPQEEFPLGDVEPVPEPESNLFAQPPVPPAPRALPDFGTPPLDVRPPVTSAPAANKEMVERLDVMAQRLSDMQTVLQRQASAAPSGSVLTPETIDKLLKIISNVTQQVDVLQRSLGATPTTAAPATNPSPAARPIAGVPTPAPAQAPAPAPRPITGAPAPAPAARPITGGAPTPAPTSAPRPITGAPTTPPAQAPANPPSANPPPSGQPPAGGGKSLGVAGGALSGLGRKPQPGGQQPPATPEK